MFWCVRGFWRLLLVTVTKSDLALLEHMKISENVQQQLLPVKGFRAEMLSAPVSHVGSSLGVLDADLRPFVTGTPFTSPLC